MLDKKSATVRELQGLAGLLNFLHRAIVPGRAFTRRMYAKFSHIIDKNGNKVAGTILRPHHHIRLDAEFKADCNIWKEFLVMQDKNKSLLCRPFVDVSNAPQAETLKFFTDAAKGEQLGMGGVYGAHWFFAQWEIRYIKNCDPSIEYLELLAICMGIFCWSEELRNLQIITFCDNQSVVAMVNQTSSSCKNCMILIHKLVLRCLEFNIRVFSKWIKGAQNFRSDFLSRMKLREFWNFVRLHGITTDTEPTRLNGDLWPASKLWVKSKWDKQN